MADRAPEPVRPLPGTLAAAAAAHPRRPAVVAGDRVLSYAELAARASAVAGALRTLAPPGAVVALTAALDPDCIAAYHGTLHAGLVVAPVNPLLREPALRHVLALSRARVAVVTAEVYPRLAAVRDALPDLAAVVVYGAGDLPAGVPRLDDLLGAPAPAAPAELDAVASLLFTSGTTGPPKAVQLTGRNLAVNAAQVARAHRLTGASVTLNHLPTLHPMHVNSAVHAGATQVLCPDADPVAAVGAANRHGATHYYSLPVRLARLAADPRLPGLALRTVTAILSGGSALAPPMAARLSGHFGIPVVQGYGLAETSPLTHCEDPADPRPGSVGRPVEGTRCRVVDLDTRAELPPGQAGEVQVRGPQVMLGYLGQPPGAALEAGWLPTGDVGRLDADGTLYLVDRVKDVFKCDNWLVSPAEVERVLAADPAVRECVVVDLPDEFSGAVAAALLVLADSAGDPDAVVARVNAQLPYYQHIRAVRVLGEIPRSPNGKVSRRDLRELVTTVPGGVS